MKPETTFRNQKVIPFLKKLNRCYYDGVTQISKSGTPDFYLCVNGYFIALELKRVGGKVSKLQEHCLKKIFEAGGIRIVATPENWEEVKQVLERISRDD